MRRVGKKKRLKPGEKPEPTVLRLKDKLQIWGFIAAMVLAGAGGVWLHRAKYHVSFQQRYHLQDAQMQKVDALEKEHKIIYPQLKARAEESRQKLEALVAAEGPAAPAGAALLAETNALREALWTEELRYCRAIAAQMTPEYAAIYLAPVEKKFANRKADSTGYLRIPHP